MKLLLISDEIHKTLYDYFREERWQDIDLILSAGDLKASYLSFLVTLIKGAPLYYVRGNHDKDYAKDPPLGCVNIHGKVVDYKGLTILGIEGSRWYGGNGVEYKEWQMKWELLKKAPHLLWTHWRRNIDIILAHSPPYNLNDGDGQAHTGFKVFRTLIEKFDPAYFIHGHQHLNYGRNERITTYKDTKIINAFQYYTLEI